MLAVETLIISLLSVAQVVATEWAEEVLVGTTFSIDICYQQSKQGLGHRQNVIQLESVRDAPIFYGLFFKMNVFERIDSSAILINIIQCSHSLENTHRDEPKFETCFKTQKLMVTLVTYSTSRTWTPTNFGLLYEITNDS